MNNRLCDHCHNEPRATAIYRLTSSGRSESYFCKKHIKSKFVRDYYSNSSVEYIGTSVKRRNLQLDHKYTIIDFDYVESEGATTCQNCNTVIVNIATIKNELGNIYQVGLDCASTLSLTDISDFWKVKEQEALIVKINKWVRDCKQTLAENKKLEYSQSETRTMIYNSYGLLFNLSNEVFNKYFKRLDIKMRGGDTK